MNEEKLMAQIFGTVWKGKYPVDWCDICDCVSISCPEENCHATSCNCGSCDKCSADIDEFNSYNCKIENYLTEEEKLIYFKCMEIKKFIIESVCKGEKEINFKKLKEDGQLCEYTEKSFENLLK